MRDFLFHRPSSLDETFTLLSEYGDDARLISGGTALVVMMKQSLVSADHLISLQQIPGLREIRREDDGLHIGALVKHRNVETSPLLRQDAPLLVEAYGHVATIRIRNQATVGGGLAHADPAQDPPPSLMVLDAKVKLASQNAERIVPLHDLFLDYYETAIEPGEVLVELIVPPLPLDATSVYLRYTPRTADDYPTVSVAALARVEDGVCQDIRIALGAAAPTPVRALSVEEALMGQTVTEESIRQAAELVTDEVDPLDDFRGSAEYKRDMAVVFTRRALGRVFGIAR